MKKASSYIFCLYLLLIAGHHLQAQKINVNLEINGSKEVAVYQNEAVLIDIAVFNKKAQADRRWNLAGEERMNELDELLRQGKIKQEEYDREKASIEKNRRLVSSVELGSDASSWTSSISWKVVNAPSGASVDLPIKLLKKPSTDGKAVLDASGYYMACYGISPEDMKSIPAGTYAIECLVNNNASAPVLLKIQNGMMDAVREGSESVLLRTGQYYWHAGDATTGLQYADKLLLKHPFSVEGHSLKGDLQLLNNSYQPALDSYNKALKEFYKQNPGISEPPEYLLGMIEWVKKQLGQ